MHKTLIYTILFLLACHSSIKYPPGGYDYPEVVADKDTNFYYYPVKNILSRRDSFYDSYMHLFFRAVDEPNISLKPLPVTVFRFLFNSYPKGNHTITLTEDEITVKDIRDNDSLLSSEPDTLLLTPTERLQVKILNRDFPIDEKKPLRRPLRQRYLDSMGQVYPRLYDPAYFHYLLDKESGTRLFHHYSYTTIKKQITKATFARLVQQIDTSGYWTLPPHPPNPNNGAFDAAGFVLEANTRYKYNIVEGCLCGGARSRGSKTENPPQTP
jgi:hypothetical protein